jgi:hypothetical protein
VREAHEAIRGKAATINFLFSAAPCTDNPETEQNARAP